jgi:hypothetical protein
MAQPKTGAELARITLSESIMPYVRRFYEGYLEMHEAGERIADLTRPV